MLAMMVLTLRLPSKRRRWICHPEYHRLVFTASWSFPRLDLLQPPNDQCHHHVHWCLCENATSTTNTISEVWLCSDFMSGGWCFHQNDFFSLWLFIICLTEINIFSWSQGDSEEWKQYWKVDLLLVGTLDTLPIDLICQRLLPVPTFPPHAWNKWSLKTFRIFYCT